MLKDELNDCDIMLGDVYMLNYYGVKVFFEVSQTDYDKVCVYELKTKKMFIDGKYRIMIDEKGKSERKSTLVVPLNENTYRKSKFWVEYANSNTLKIPIDMNMPIYKEAVARGVNCPVYGTAFAVYVPDWYNKYWDYYDYEDFDKEDVKGYEC